MKKCKRANEKKWGRALGKRAEVSKAYVKQGSSKLHWRRTANHSLWKTRRLCRTQVTNSSVSAVPFISPNKYQRCLRSNQSLQNNIKIHLWLISNIYTCPIDCLIFLSIFTTSWERKQETRSRVQIREVPLCLCVDVGAELTPLLDVGVSEVCEGEVGHVGWGDGEAWVVGGTVPAMLQGVVRRGWWEILRSCRGPTGRMITGCLWKEIGLWRWEVIVPLKCTTCETNQTV